MTADKFAHGMRLSMAMRDFFLEVNLLFHKEIGWMKTGYLIMPVNLGNQKHFSRLKSEIEESNQTFSY